MIRPVINFLLFSLLLSFVIPSFAVEQRDIHTVGEIVSVKGDEEIRFLDHQSWERVIVGQKLAPGDTVQTGPYGELAILLIDDTQIRIHRNSIFVIEEVEEKDDTFITKANLIKGSLWSRTAAVFRGVTGFLAPLERKQSLELKTPSSAIGIRGTDWHVSVGANGSTMLTVIVGQAQFSNDFGSISVSRGEVAIAEIGAAPVKRVIVDLKDRPLIVLDMTLSWREIISITGETMTELGKQKYRLSEPLTADTDEVLNIAETAYDLGDYKVVSEALNYLGNTLNAGTNNKPVSEQYGRFLLLMGLIKIREGLYQDAEELFHQASGMLNGHRRMITLLANAGMMVDQHRYNEVDQLIKQNEKEFSNHVEGLLFKAWLTSFQGEPMQAVELGKDVQLRFPNNARVSALLAYFYFLVDQRPEMNAAFTNALMIDPGLPFAWHIKGIYYQYVEPDANSAKESYHRAVEINPSYSGSWNNLGLVYFDLGDYKAAVFSMQEAIRSDPVNTVNKSNYGLILAWLGRLDEAEKIFKESQAVKLNEQYSLVGLGVLDLYRGLPEAAVEKFLKASVIDPELPGINVELGAAYYQAGRFGEANHALTDAKRTDPDDPIPYVIGSIMAVDHFEAGEAIRLAREGFEKTLKTESFAVENLANSKSGSATLGFAFSNLGLHEWGGYYTQLAFDPYLANGYFYLSDANQFASERARLGANRQGLMLDPTAVSSPTRYYEPFRQPRNDVTLFGSAGSHGGAFANTTQGVVQGFIRNPDPLAYYASLSRTDNDGFRINNDSTVESLLATVGTTRGERKHNLLFVLDAQRFRNGEPGSKFFSDPDDRFNDRFLLMDLGYQYRINFNNRLMFRVSGGLEHIEDLSRNDIDFPIDTNLVCTLPCNSDSDFDSHILFLQFRHLLDVGPVEVTYGADSFNSDTAISRRVDFKGFSPATEEADFDLDAMEVYVKGRWKITPDLWLDAGIFRRKLEQLLFDPDFSGTPFFFETFKHQNDPQLGLAWRVTPNHWLRIAAQRALTFPQRASDTLAPVDTVGLVIEDQFISAFEGGPSVKDFRLRWDAEWTPHIFTYADYNHQIIEDFSRSGFFFNEGKVDSVIIGTNIWFLERFGLRARYGWLWSEDPDDGLDLPAIQETLADVSLSWVHPRHVRADVFASYVGERWNDPANTDRLDSYWTMGFTVNWQPVQKHWSFTLTALDLFNDAPEFSKGFPEAGRSAFLSAEYRF